MGRGEAVAGAGLRPGEGTAEEPPQGRSGEEPPVGARSLSYLALVLQYMRCPNGP